MEAQKVFFSYSRADAEFALKLATDLRNAGANIWIDQLDIGPGETWDLEIEKSLAGCQSIMAILSSTSVASNNVLNEIYYALEEGKQVLPVVIDDCKIPFRIKRLQHIDLRANYDQGLSRILKALNLAQKSARVDAVPVSESASEEGLHQQEELSWQNAQQKNSINEYRHYLKTYPQGKYLTQAAAAINSLKEDEQKIKLPSQQQDESEEIDSQSETPVENTYDEEISPPKRSSRLWMYLAATVALGAIIVFFIFFQKSGNDTPDKVYSIANCISSEAKARLSCYTGIANSGNDTAMFMIGMLYEKGDGVTQNYDSAFEWYRKAALAGNTSAMFNLGNFYAEGKGVARDTINAWQWFNTANNMGNTAAGDRAKKLAVFVQQITREDSVQKTATTDTTKKQENSLAQKTDGTKTADDKTGDSKTGDNKIGDNKTASIKTADNKAVDTKKGDSKTADNRNTKPTADFGTREDLGSLAFVKIFSRGTRVVQDGYEFDLEIGKNTGKNSDFYWKRQTLTPMHNSSFTILTDADFEKITLDDLNKLQYSRSSIKAQQLSPGIVLAAHTFEGRYAKIRIENYGTALTIRWVTFDKNSALTTK